MDSSYLLIKIIKFKHLPKEAELLLETRLFVTFNSLIKWARNSLEHKRLANTKPEVRHLSDPDG